jgi:starvation-inducible DNA-binding protein
MGASAEAHEGPVRPVGAYGQALHHQHGVEVQKFGALRALPIVLGSETRAASCAQLNQILADSIVLCSLYKRHHWLVLAQNFYQLHLLLDKHACEQLELLDAIGERVHVLGGIAVTDPRHVSEIADIPRPPTGAEEVKAVLSRLLEAHEIIIEKVRSAVVTVTANGDDGTADLLVRQVLRRHESQAWFIYQQFAGAP